MKKAVMFICLALALAGCEATDAALGKYNPLAGTWKMKDNSSNPMVVKFRKDYIYEVDFEGDGKADIWGSYKLLFEHEVVLTDEGGQVTDDCHQPGVYQYKSWMGENRYIVVGDGCSARRQALSVAWEKVKK